MTRPAPLRKLRTFLRQSAASRGIILRSLLLIPWVYLRLRFTGLKRTAGGLRLNLAGDAAAAGSPSPAAIMEAVTIAQAVNRVAGNVPGGKHCLTRSLVLLHLMQQHQLQGRLRIGVTAPAAFRAHAWVEFAGIPINDDPQRLAPYRTLKTPMDALRGAGPATRSSEKAEGSA